jgi:hypothetical protein
MKFIFEVYFYSKITKSCTQVIALRADFEMRRQSRRYSGSPVVIVEAASSRLNENKRQDAASTIPASPARPH